MGKIKKNKRGKSKNQAKTGENDISWCRQGKIGELVKT